MAEALRKCIPDLIHENQIGFVPKRYMKDNIRYLLNAIGYLRRNGGGKTA